MAEGSLVIDENKQYLIDEWRKSYNEGKLESYAAKMASKKKRAIKKARKAENKKHESKVEWTEISIMFFYISVVIF